MVSNGGRKRSATEGSNDSSDKPPEPKILKTTDSDDATSLQTKEDNAIVAEEPVVDNVSESNDIVDSSSLPTDHSDKVDKDTNSVIITDTN